jgi:hypothetical protein
MTAQSESIKDAVWEQAVIELTLASDREHRDLGTILQLCLGLKWFMARVF